MNDDNNKVDYSKMETIDYPNFTKANNKLNPYATKVSEFETDCFNFLDSKIESIKYTGVKDMNGYSALSANAMQVFNLMKMHICDTHNQNVMAFIENVKSAAIAKDRNEYAARMEAKIDTENTEEL